jgi:hypothetical protein
VRDVALVLTRIRTLGLTHPGQVMEGLPPDEPEDTEAGKDLPDAVMRQLWDHLDVLEQTAGREARVGTELLMDTGRRPEEIRGLPLDCLAQDRMVRPSWSTTTSSPTAWGAGCRSARPPRRSSLASKSASARCSRTPRSAS